MQKKKIRIMEISSFVLVLIMLALFSTSTIMMTTPKKAKNEGGRLIQFSQSGDIYGSIKKLEFTNTNIKPGESIGIDVEVELYKDIEKKEVEGNYDVKFIGIWAKSIDSGHVFYSSANANSNFKSLPTTTTLYTSSNFYIPGTYKVIGLTIGIQSITDKTPSGGGIVFLNSEDCSNSLECDNMVKLQKSFTLYPPQQEDNMPIYEYSFGLLETDKEVSIGDEIRAQIRRIDQFDEVHIARKELKSMMLSYTNETDGNIIDVFVKSINSNPYIVIPSNATVGKYNLDFGYLTFTDDTAAKYKNTDDKVFSYNSSFIVKEKPMETSKYYFNNESYDQSVLEDLNKLDNDAIITVNASSFPIINEEVFNSIQNTKRVLIIEYETSQWVFNGADIKNSKTIDVSILFSNLTENNEYYNSFLKTNIKSPSAMLQFTDNGDLPGKVLIKIDKESINAYLENPNSVYVYYYKEDTDQLVKVAMEIQSNDEFYEFYINHNSKYIITSEEIKTKVVSDDASLLSLNQQSVVIQQQSLPISYIIATICGIVAIIITITVYTKKKQMNAE